ncbi:MAG: hypothetical protein CVU36_19610 [Betaproteobacteria bacterium HGW-Betaproteobacteria-9]|jgi:hypothetical protein|nr:MAG: hypothetical protein CVU36_19610 [Betaproteobacteria bacterium HGW-Betaproteobacteria-9]
MKQPQKRWCAGLCLLGLALAWATPSAAQTTPAQPASAATPCPPLDENPARLLGLWQLALWLPDGNEVAPVSTGALLFERHPDYPGSVRGHLKRSSEGHDVLALVSGDVSDGIFNLDESTDGVAMDAVWTGTPQDCGQVIRGTRRPAEGRESGVPVLRFSLHKAPGGH